MLAIHKYFFAIALILYIKKAHEQASPTDNIKERNVLNYLGFSANILNSLG